jgi:hypothetical protein
MGNFKQFLSASGSGWRPATSNRAELEVHDRIGRLADAAMDHGKHTIDYWAMSLT